MTAPIVLAGTTDSGRRYVQFWTEGERIAGRDVAFCLAEMNLAPEYAPPFLEIQQSCPPDTVDQVLAAFAMFRFGGDVEPTHTVEWAFGKPTFTPIPTPEPEPGLLALLEETV
ncbi:hypothetical protein GCM10009775_04370 [Microbacterium aoyamense]|uniref:Uncharacterized protein n=1 Tax=Microbacterium aoyamense TaxID=344166 RepID=A0ABN2P8V1_9MICO|nr:hypothetical protein [Microbacterium aoyamense]